MSDDIDTTILILTSRILEGMDKKYSREEMRDLIRDYLTSMYLIGLEEHTITKYGIPYTGEEWAS